MILRLILCLSLAIAAVTSLPITKERLRFKLSAKGLPDKDNIGTIDPYVQVFYTQSGSTKETKLGQTDAINDNENPDWGTVFEFDYDRSKNQQWHFLIWDKDHAREDDKGGQVWVDVNDYVDKGQLINANLDKQGYLTAKAADPHLQQTRSEFAPGTLPYARGSPDAGALRFKVSANGLNDKDNFGKTDPYVEIFSTDGLTGRQIKIGRSTTLSNTKNPQWGETFTFNWDRRKDQRLLFKVFDHDSLREDDKAGLAWLEVNDYVAKGQVMTVHLSKQGTLTLARADGLPPNPYNPALAQNNPQFPASPPRSQPFPVPSSQLPSFPNNQPRGQPTNPSQFPGSSPQNQHSPSSQLPSFPNPQQSRGPPAVAPPRHQQPIAPALPPRNQFPIPLRFKLSASNLADKDLVGTSDPYVKVYITQSGQPEAPLKTGSKLHDNENPQWADIYEISYDPAKKQQLRFLILDQDDNVRDDELGNVTLDASELELRLYVILRLPQGTLTVTKV